MSSERPGDRYQKGREDPQPINSAGPWAPEHREAKPAPDFPFEKREDREAYAHHGKDIGDEIDLWV